MRSKSILPAIFYSVFIVLILSLMAPAYSQSAFSVVSTLPVNGAAGVDTAGTVSITFSAPIDPTALFPSPGDFFMDLYVFPDSLIDAPDSVTFSPDMQTVSLHNIHLAQNTEYYFVIVDAVSQSGDSLDRPYDLTFTTAPAIPTGSVSGTIIYTGDPTGTLVALFPENPFGNGSDNGSLGIIVTDQTGAYSANYLPDGTYWPVALKNFYIGENNSIEFEEGSALGFYDGNGDQAPDSIVLGATRDLSNIDITLHALIPRTARTAYTSVQTAASSWSSDAVLTAVSGDFDITGYGMFWQFGFYSPSLQESRVWFTLSDLFFPATDAEFNPDTVALPANWIDSDSMLTVAEANGGSDFRTAHPDAEFWGFLSYPFVYNEGDQNRSASVSYPVTIMTFNGSHQIRPFLENSQPGLNPPAELPTTLPAIWQVEYYSDQANENFRIAIDAVTGQVLSNPATAGAAKTNADIVANEWAQDAQLWQVWAGWHGIDAGGLSDWWSLVYYSASLDSFQVVYTMGQIPVNQGSLDWVPFDTLLVPDGWIDSDLGMAAAEAAGGSAYRSANDSVYVEATLSYWGFGENPDRVVWYFRYHSTNAAPLEIQVDAMTGTVITGIENGAQSNLIDKFKLHQNYPNPFNPSTLIEYDVPRASQIELVVYSTLGQKVATLVDGFKPAGNYKLQWEPKSLSSGIYLLVLKTQKVKQVRKMYLIR